MADKINKRVFNVQMEEDMLAAIKKIAADNERSMGAQVRVWIDEGIRRELAKDG